MMCNRVKFFVSAALRIVFSYAVVLLPMITFHTYVYYSLGGAQYFSGAFRHSILEQVLYYKDTWQLLFFALFLLFLFLKKVRWKHFVGILIFVIFVIQAFNLAYIISVNMQGINAVTDGFVQTMSFTNLLHLSLLETVFFVLSCLIMLATLIIPYFLMPSWEDFFSRSKVLQSQSIKISLMSVSLALIVSMVFVVLNAPFYKAYKGFFVREQVIITRANELEKKDPFLKDAFFKKLQLSSPHKPYNIVWIFIESFERGYFNIPHLIPDLEEIGKHSYQFTNIHQLKQINITMYGTFAQLCGLYVGRNNVKDFHHCLPSSLVQAHYHTVAISGLRKVALSMGKVFSDAGMETTLGFYDLDRIRPGLPEDYAWGGVYDHGLFEATWPLFLQYSKKEKPFFMTIATMDNHMPFRFVSPMCRKYSMSNLAPENRLIGRAAFCSDKTVSSFIRRIRSSKYSKNTIIVVTGDHLNHDGPGMRHLAKETQAQRRLFFLINFPDGRARVINNIGTHYDIGATVLEAAGFGAHQVGLGWSLLSHKKGYVDTHVKLKNQDLVSMIQFHK